MLNDLHIDDFCQDVARTFIQLYKRFPIKDILYLEDVCGPDEVDEFGLHSKRYLACLAAVEWLANAGYLSYDSTIREEAYEGAVLTHKAFTFLASFESDRSRYPTFYKKPAREGQEEHEEKQPVEIIEVNKLLRRIDLIFYTVKHSTSDDLKSLIISLFLVANDYT